MKARVNTYLNIRTRSPEILPDNNPNDLYFNPGDLIEVVETIVGEEYKGNNVWHKLETNEFVSNVGVDINENVFFKESTAISTTNNLSKKIILNNPIGKNGSGITIGILDSGVDTGHIELKESLKSEENFMTDPKEKSVTNNHGTNIAGLLTGNDKEISGLTVDAVLKSFRVIKSSNSIDEFALQKALNYISINDTGVDILNLSFEVLDSSFPFFADTFNKIIEKDIILVVAGNKENSTSLNSLALLKNVIVVGAFDANDFDKIPQPINIFFLNSPITTTNIFSSDQKYNSFSDTSAYTAIVSGIIGKFLSNKFIAKDKRYREVTGYLNSCSFNSGVDKSPFKMYKNVTN